MHSAPLPEILILIAAAVCIVALFRMLRLSPVLGYLVAGAIIGPHGVAWIRDVNQVSAIAELGVVFLLFVIGLELSLVRLRAMRNQVFGVGSVQLLLSGLAIGVVAVAEGSNLNIAIIVGGGLALSSTALVLQMLDESHERASPVGRLSLAILIFQDLAVMPLLVLVPLLAQDTGAIAENIGHAMLRAMGALVLIFIAGRLILRPLYRFIASLKNEELFVATTLLVALGMSWLTESFGLSLALGAFIAGLLVAETEFSHQVEADVKPYKGLLMGLFFMTVGMRVDMHMVIEQLDVVVLATLMLLTLKASIVWLILRCFRHDNAVAFHTAMLLSQGGEFGFILFALAGEMDVMHDALAQFLLVIISISMALTPLLSAIGQRVATRLRKEELQADMRLMAPKPAMREMEDHVVVAGFGYMGKLVGKLLESEHINYVGLDYASEAVTQARKAGRPVYYGDAMRDDVLELVGLGRARAVIITFKDDRLRERMVKGLRLQYPHLPIICRSRNVAEALQLEKEGAHAAVPELFEGSLQIGAALLKVLGVPDHEIRHVTQSYRAEVYAQNAAQLATNPLPKPL